MSENEILWRSKSFSYLNGLNMCTRLFLTDSDPGCILILGVYYSFLWFSAKYTPLFTNYEYITLAKKKLVSEWRQKVNIVGIFIFWKYSEIRIFWKVTFLYFCCNCSETKIFFKESDNMVFLSRPFFSINSKTLMGLSYLYCSLR